MKAGTVHDTGGNDNRWSRYGRQEHGRQGHGGKDTGGKDTGGKDTGGTGGKPES